MDTALFELFNVVITPWKLIGYLGVFLFTGRWVIQLLATRRQRRPVIPRLFWLMSIAGSALLLAYFIWGRNDSVGVLSNLFPMAVAAYNLFMERLASRKGSPARAHVALRSEARSLDERRSRALRSPSTRTLGPPTMTAVSRRTAYAEHRRNDFPNRSSPP